MKRLIFLLFILMYVSCAKTEKKRVETEYLKIYKKIKLSDNYDYGEIDYMNSKEMVIGILGAKELFVFLDRQRNYKVDYKIERGKGPNELISSDWVINPEGRYLFYSTYTQEVYELKDRKMSSIGKLKTGKECPINVTYNGNYYICSGGFHKGRFGIFDKEGNLVKETGYLPVRDSLKVDNFKYGLYVYQSYMYPKPSDPNYIVCLTAASELLEIYKFNPIDKSMKRVNKINLSDNIKYVDEEKTEAYINDKCELGIRSMAYNSKFIYALINDDHTFADFLKNPRVIYTKKVRVYDWKGNMIKKYILENAEAELYLYNDKLYAIGADAKGNPEIDVYKLDK